MDRCAINLCNMKLLYYLPSEVKDTLFSGFGFDVQNLVLRRIYPFLLGVVGLVGFCIFQARQFRRLYEHIKNDK